MLIQKTLELNALEKELEDLDAQDDQAEETRYRLQIGEHYDGWDPTQKDLIDKISGKLADYGKEDCCFINMLQASNTFIC